MKTGTKIGLGFATFVAIGIASAYMRNAEHGPYSAAEIAASAAEARAEAASSAADAAKKAEGSKASLRAYSAAKGALIVQSEMRNPDSFQLIAVGDMVGGALCYEFRSQNGFGGMETGRASLVNKVVSVSEAKYKKECAGKAGADITAQVGGMMEFARTGKML
jgi:hypothetical protein